MEFKALEPYRNKQAERASLPHFNPAPALLRCGVFCGASFVLSQDSDGQIEFSLRGQYGRRERRALTRMLGLDLTRDSDYVRTEGNGDLWVFPGKRKS